MTTLTSTSSSRAPGRYKAGWSGFLRHLKARGLTGVELIISNACSGLIESAGEFYPQALWQRCTVHFYRNVFGHTPARRS